MKRFTAFALMLSVAVLAGCSTHHAVELRPYTAEETHQLAMEDLNRRGLSYEEYHLRKAQLQANPQQQQVREFDRNAEVNVDLGRVSKDRQG